MTSFESFKESFKGDIVDSSSPDYEIAIRRWAGNAIRRAKYVFFVKDAEDVSIAIKYAVANKIAIAVKGGGHNPSGASSIEDGICIDLSRYINHARVDPERKTIDAGGGALWRDVDYAAYPHNLATVGGTVNETGIGGYLLGGGHGILTGLHGEAVDSILEMTVVTADGSIVTANKDSYPDLFWALRGGGGNCGVVVNFKLQLYDQNPNVYAGMLIFNPAQLDELIKVFDEWLPHITEKDYCGLAFTRGPDRSPMVLMIILHNGTVEEGRLNYKPFFDLGPVADMTREMPYTAGNELLNATSTLFRRYYMTGSSLRGPVATHGRKLFERVLALTEKNPIDEAEKPFEVTTIYEVANLKKVMSVSPDTMAFRNRGHQQQVLISLAWDKELPNDTEFARSISRELVAIVEEGAVTQPKEYETDFYMNYTTDIDHASKSKAERLWGNNLPKLREIKLKYDPDNIFNRWLSPLA